MSDLDELDRKILRVIQADASLPLEEIAARVNSTKSPVWNRLKKLRAAGVIAKQVAIIDAEKVGIGETFFLAIRTDQHSTDWLQAFAETVAEMEEIQEAHRLTGDVDYLLKVRVESTQAFDEFYKAFVDRISLFNVTSSLVMERLKDSTRLKI